MPLYQVADATIRASTRLPGLTSGGGLGRAWQLRVAQLRVPRGVEWYHSAVLPATNKVWQMLGRTAGKHVIRFPSLATFIVDRASREIHCLPERRSLSPRLLSQLLHSQVMPLVFSERRVCLHASGVQIGSDVIGFAGQSGRGKSTIAAFFAARGFPLVTDDCLVVDTGRASVRVVPVAAGVHLWPDAAKSLVGAIGARGGKRRFDVAAVQPTVRSRPRLRRVYLLDPVRQGGPEGPQLRAGHDEQVRITEVRGPDAVVALLRESAQLDSDRPAALHRSFARLAAVVESVPVRRLIYVQQLRTLDELIDCVLTDVQEY